MSRRESCDRHGVQYNEEAKEAYNATVYLFNKEIPAHMNGGPDNSISRRRLVPQPMLSVGPPRIDGARAYEGSLMEMEPPYKANGDSVVLLDPPQTETGHHDEGERRQEERFWVDQKRLSGQEKAERAREILELMRQRELEQQRMTAGLCVFCGRRLGIVLRWFRAKKHRGCHSFTE